MKFSIAEVTMVALVWVLCLHGCASTLPDPRLGVDDTVVERGGKCYACYGGDGGECELIDMEFCGEEPQLAEQPASELEEESPGLSFDGGRDTGVACDGEDCFGVVEGKRVSCNSCSLDIKQPGVMQCELTGCDPTGAHTVKTPYLLMIGSEAIVVLGTRPAASP